MKMLFTLVKDVTHPSRAHVSDSGIDFFVPNDLIWVQMTPSDERPWRKLEEDERGKYIPVLPWEGALIPSGVKVCVPFKYDLVFANKSWVSSKTWLIVWAQVVDSSYRGEIHLHLINTSTMEKRIYLGQKLVQGIIREVILADLEQIEVEQYETLSDTERGQSGFGSTWS